MKRKIAAAAAFGAAAVAATALAAPAHAATPKTFHNVSNTALCLERRRAERSCRRPGRQRHGVALQRRQQPEVVLNSRLAVVR